MNRRLLIDSETGADLGTATGVQAAASDSPRAINGLFLVDADGDPVDDGSWDAQQPGVRTVWVTEA